MRIMLVCLLLTVSNLACAQKNGNATATGNCNITISGNNNTVQTANALNGKCGIGKEQGEKIIQLLNTVLAKKDVAEINAKLNELIAIAAKPTPLVINCGNAGNCAGTNNGTQVVNQYGTPKLSMTDSQQTIIRDAMKGHASPEVDVLCDRSEEASQYAAQLANALHDAGMNISTPTCATMLGDQGHIIPPGIYFVLGKNRSQDATTLATAMQTAGLTNSGINARMDGAHPDAFLIFVTPNR